MKPFCIYFPQFYSTQVNNDVWGNGFTDWVLVASANMRKIWNRRAPRRGFYDGSDRQIHFSQISEMQQAGLGGVALYHYWFFNNQELSAFEETLLSKQNESNFPWFLIWATESWSKRWIGDGTEIITLKANPSDDDIDKHCVYLHGCFSNESYYRINGQPLFLFYNIAHFPNAEDVIRRYRKAFTKYGHNPVIGQLVKNPFDLMYAQHVDINYLFEPRLFFGFNNIGKSQLAKRVLDSAKLIFGNKFCQKLLVFSDKLKKKSKIYSAKEYLSYLSSDLRSQFIAKISSPVQEVISPGWNNVPRHGERFTAIAEMDPEQFASLLLKAEQFNPSAPPLINAWNEWSEGASIEPCAYLGSNYIDAISR